MVTINNSVNNAVGGSNSGATNTFTISNDSNTASSAAVNQITVGGATAADAQTTYTVTGATSWSTGIDNSASDAYVIAASTALGTTNVISAATGGAVSVVLGNLDVTKSASGADVSVTASNTSNTASSTATHYATVAGTSAGDAQTQYAVSGTTTWTQGIDNSVTGDPFVLAASSALGTTNVVSAATSGEINYPLQPSFLAAKSTGSTNATGDGTVVTIVFDSEAFDQNSDYNNSTGIFTAPVTGKYLFHTCVYFSNLGSGHTAENLSIVTTGRTFIGTIVNPFAVSQSNATNCVCTAIVDMTAGDTSKVNLSVSNSTKTVTIAGQAATAPLTYFSGYLIC